MKRCNCGRAISRNKPFCRTCAELREVTISALVLDEPEPVNEDRSKYLARDLPKTRTVEPAEIRAIAAGLALRGLRLGV